MVKGSVRIEDFTNEQEKKKHSPFSASGAERWFECPGSVNLSKDLPDVDSPWSIEGTRAHGVLDRILKAAIDIGVNRITEVVAPRTIPHEMLIHGKNAANFLLRLHHRTPNSILSAEEKVHLPLHSTAFGTYDGRVIEHFGTLHIYDYKYGAGHAVRPKENLQLIFYSVATLFEFDWNFSKVRHWIDQPRIKGYDGPSFWEIPAIELKKVYVPQFEKAIERVLKEPETYKEGGHCHWCKAKKKCPLKLEAKTEKAVNIFRSAPHAEKEIRKIDEYYEAGGEIETAYKSEEAEKARGKRGAKESPFGKQKDFY